jgi:murein L,D-transpeptidase YafK
VRSPKAEIVSKKPVARKRRRWVLPVFLLLAAAFIAAIFAYDRLGEDADSRAIRIERAQRYAMTSVGLALPGTPDLSDLPGRLAAHGVKLGSPIFMRIFKRDFELELWMQRDGRFHKFATYPICRWSGKLGPKLKQGDRQAPEGFYSVDAKALNPNSRWHRSFNLGFPNAFDQASGRTGSFVMVHGGCGSVGCYAMTNPVVDELWRIVTAALDGGQKRFQVQVFPFRMTDANLERARDNPNAEFWRDLKKGNDLFEAEYMPPRVSVCGQRYGFEAAGSVKDGSAPIAVQCSAPRAAELRKT